MSIISQGPAELSFTLSLESCNSRCFFSAGVSSSMPLTSASRTAASPSFDFAAAGSPDLLRLVYEFSFLFHEFASLLVRSTGLKVLGVKVDIPLAVTADGLEMFSCKKSLINLFFRRDMLRHFLPTVRAFYFQPVKFSKLSYALYEFPRASS